MKDKNLDLKDAADYSVSETVVDSAKNTPLNTLDGPLDKESDLTIKESLTKYGDLEVFFSKDPKYLEQYYKLRYKSFTSEHGFSSYPEEESRFDRKGKIVLVTDKDRVIGGMRIMYSDQGNYLSNELPGTQYEYKKIIQKYDKRDNLVIGEISSVIVDMDYRDTSVTKAMLDFSFKYATEHGCHYLFAITMITIARNYRKVLVRLGYDLEIMINFIWMQKAVFNFVRMFPIYTKLQ